MATTNSAAIYEEIYALVAQIPAGKVATYGQIARMWGRPNHARQVGYALFQLAPSQDVPWHRVVNAQGKISASPARMGSDDLQKVLLEAESIRFNGDRIDLKRYQWNEIPEHSSEQTPL
ncbi:MAG: MGMT family protein [Cyanobacteria bacterium P01_F01_bin.42]